jgi:hypothetical protein
MDGTSPPASGAPPASADLDHGVGGRGVPQGPDRTLPSKIMPPFIGGWTVPYHKKKKKKHPHFRNNPGVRAKLDAVASKAHGHLKIKP